MKLKWTIACVLVMLMSCESDSGLDGFNSLIQMSEEMPGENCIGGGQRLDTGLDTNRNGALDTTEVQTTEYVCNGSNGSDGSSDKLTRIDFLFDSFGEYETNTTTPMVLNSTIVDFNKLDYGDVDSIIFVPRISSQSGAYSFYVQLYNSTDKVPLTQVETTLTHPSYVYSKDLKNTLPAKKITLSIRIWLEAESVYIYGRIHQAHLLIYRH
jgi:hypothetical protein